MAYLYLPQSGQVTCPQMKPVTQQVWRNKKNTFLTSSYSQIGFHQEASKYPTTFQINQPEVLPSYTWQLPQINISSIPQNGVTSINPYKIPSSEAFFEPLPSPLFQYSSLNLPAPYVAKAVDRSRHQDSKRQTNEKRRSKLLEDFRLQSNYD